MQFLRRLFEFYVFSSIHVALGVYCFVKITLVYFQIDDKSTSIFTFFSTILSYNFIRFLNVANGKNWLANWYVTHKPLLAILSVISIIGCMVLSFYFRIEALVMLIPFIVLTFFYGRKLPKRMTTLRRIPGLKILLIAFCFSGVTVLLPLVQNKVVIGVNEWWYFLQRLFFVILITLPFDIRDVDFDSSQLKTIPQRMGIINAKILGIFLTGIILLIEFVILENENSHPYIVLIISILSILFLLFSSKNQSKYFSAFWVEALPIIWYVFLLAINL